VDDIEKALKAALQREPAPDGFREQVLRKSRSRSAPVAAWWRLPLLRWSVAGVVAVVCIVGGVSEHRRQERMRGEEARQQVLMALRITGAKLRVVQKQIVKTSDEEGDPR